MEILFNKLIGTKKLRYFIGALICIAAVVVGLVFVKKAQYIGRYHFYSVKISALPSEVTIGSAINLFGLKVGKVERIKISNDYDGIEMRISILKDVRDNLRTDARLTIIPKLFGSPELSLETGKSSDALGNTSTICVVVDQSVDQLIRENLKSIHNDIIPLVSSGVENFSVLAKRLNSIDFDKIGLLITSLEEITQQSNKFILSLNKLQTDLRDTMIKINSTMDNMESFTNRINKFAENTLGDEKNLADAINKIFTNTENLIQSANVISRKTKTLLNTFEKSGKNLNTMSSDIIQITNTLPTLIKSMNKMAEDFSIIGSALQRHWLLKNSVENVKKEFKMQKSIQEKNE